ncbi:hypothetical protein AC624_16025 [Bacillus sp. FJAT-27238]|nr:hypothetical protein AC624_16025 [Bacillus sp. FJAT-27238]
MLSLIGLLLFLTGLFFMVVGPFAIIKKAPKEWRFLKKFGVGIMLMVILEAVSGFTAWIGLLLL